MVASPTAGAGASTGQAITLTYTKTSSTIIDGTQTGNVLIHFTGPDAFDSTTKPYSFAGGASQALVWTVRLPTQGTYTFTFDDTQSAGTPCDTSITNYVVNPYAVLDWVAVISPPAGGFLSPQGDSLMLDNIGDAYFSFDQLRSCGPSTCLTDAVNYGFEGRANKFTSTGGTPWATASGCTLNQPSFQCIYRIWPDNGGRVVEANCVGAWPTMGQLRPGGSAWQVSASLRDLDRTTGVAGSASANAYGCAEGENSVAVGSNSVNEFTIENKNGVGTKLVKRGTNLQQVFGVDIGGCDAFPGIGGTGNGVFLSIRSACFAGQEDRLSAFDPSTGAFTPGGTGAILLHGAFGASNVGYPAIPSRTAANTWFFEGLQTTAGQLQWEKITVSGTTTTIASSGTFTPTAPTRGDVAMGTLTFGGFDLDNTDKSAFCFDYIKSVATDKRPVMAFADAAQVIQGYIEIPFGTAGSIQKCLAVRLDQAGGVYVAVARGEHSCMAGVSVNCYNELAIIHFNPPSPSQTTPRFTPDPPAPPPQSVVPVDVPSPPPATDCTFAGDASTVSDVGNGYKQWIAAMMGTSVGSLFFGGLLVVIIVFLAVSGAFAAIAKTYGVPALIAGSVGGLGIMMFNVATTTWEAWVGVVMIAIVAALVAWMLRQAIFSGGGGAGGEQ